MNGDRSPAGAQGHPLGGHRRIPIRMHIPRSKAKPRACVPVQTSRLRQPMAGLPGLSGHEPNSRPLNRPFALPSCGTSRVQGQSLIIVSGRCTGRTGQLYAPTMTIIRAGMHPCLFNPGLLLSWFSSAASRLEPKGRPVREGRREDRTRLADRAMGARAERPRQAAATCRAGPVVPKPRRSCPRQSDRW